MTTYDEQVFELLMRWGPHLDHGGDDDACAGQFRPRSLRGSYPRPGHRVLALRIARRGRRMADFACPRGHVFNVLRPQWPKGDSNWWGSNAGDEVRQDVSRYVEEQRGRFIRRTAELGFQPPIRAVMLIGADVDDQALDTGSWTIPAHRVVAGKELERYEACRAAIRAGIYTDDEAQR
jgi:hypothetical protein